MKTKTTIFTYFSEDFIKWSTVPILQEITALNRGALRNIKGVIDSTRAISAHCPEQLEKMEMMVVFFEKKIEMHENLITYKLIEK